MAGKKLNILLGGKKNMENQAIELQKEFKNDVLGSPYMPQSFSEKLKLAEVLCQSGLCPKDMNTPQKVFVALQYGHELGLSPMVSVNNIAISNGRPTLMTEVMKAIVFKTGKIKNYKVQKIRDEKGNIINIIISGKRDDLDFEYESSFSVDNAITAGLLERTKDGSITSRKDNWAKYMEDMLEHRANSRLFRRLFPELLAGFLTPEEADELPPIRDVTPPKNNFENIKNELENEDFARKTINELEEIKAEIMKENDVLKKTSQSSEKSSDSRRKYRSIKENNEVELPVIEVEKKGQEIANFCDSEDEIVNNTPDDNYNPEQALLTILKRAKAVKPEMDDLTIEYFKRISEAIQAGKYDFEVYRKEVYEDNIKMIEKLEKRMVEKKSGGAK